MSQIGQVSKTLKQLLKQHQITYRALADKLAMSEANIKRIFSTNSFTLERLEEICDILQMSLSDLFVVAQQQTEKLSQLTEEQELQLLADPKLLLVAVCVRDSWKFNELIEHYDIDQYECTRLLAKLDKLKIISLLPNNYYKTLIAQDFRWIPGGPLEKFMEQEVMVKFMAPKKDEKWNFRLYIRGRYSQTSIEIIQRKLNQLTKEASDLNQEDASLPLSKRQHMGILMAMRPWEPSLFESMRRVDDGDS
ncbi:helix-turn-helix transcriptional regulator [Aliiglaciecola sp. 3_MG-2023]|uniref:helix-turn-helix domain-containing protein n=1 Tax=Aliiglaciecola sp. 3_MG-2023 TaxID=3062644 RepID=UPI0026E16989|nr:helix-turn-helix transcriptional regulator [Aliiglaciecola sp. 3_MG-2023]MDO6693625.1 helix-turn-helix transcriptional regulator [Aliiglaciecola sp. 3_MG-2023]